MAQASPASVEFRQVSKRYDKVTALNAVTFTIAPGTLVTLLGPSGCGKTTILRLIAGLEMATAGQILIGGEDVTRLSAAERGVSMVFQSYALFPHMNVLENAAYGPTVSGLPRKEAEAMAAEKLALMGLQGFEKRLPSELSGGQQQRVAVARALVLEPRVLLFDEPLSNLDAKLRRRVREDIRDLQQRLNLTVAYVTHDQEEALAVSDRVIVMSNAAIAQDGSPRELYEQPNSLFVADFIGDSNIVDAEIAATTDDMAEVRLGELSLRLPRHGLGRGPAKLAIRPESILIDTAGENPAGQSGRVIKAAYLGSHMEYSIETAIGVLFVVDAAVDRPRAVGSAVTVRYRTSGLALLPDR
jgi:iron(III) transport system ATP-binding protein